MITAKNDPLNLPNNPAHGFHNSLPTDLMQSLIQEIARVKDLIKSHESLTDNGGLPGLSVLNELVAEAQDSLVNYDTVLMKKYFDLLQNCD